jgi:hypothetical protein
MKITFTKLEDKFIFNLSRYFWHFVIGLISLATITSLCFVIWGVIPAFKKTVVKDAYPPIEKVSLTEIAQAMNGKRNDNPPKANTPAPDQTVKSDSIMPKITEQFDQDPEVMKAYNNLKVLIPPDKYNWEGVGHWYYPYGNYWQQYKEWKEDYPSINGSLKKIFTSIGLSSAEKKELLSMYADNIKKYRETERIELLRFLIHYGKDNFADSKAVLQILNEATDIYSPDKNGYLIHYGRVIKDYRDAISLLTFINKFVSNFEFNNRINIAEEVLREYDYRYAGEGKDFAEISNGFIPFLTGIVLADQAKYLRVYYNLSYKKNDERKTAIRSIDNRYNSDLTQAENELLEKKLKKEEYLLQGVYGFGAGIASVAFIGILLVLFSMQRYIKKIYESNNPKQDN